MNGCSQNDNMESIVDKFANLECRAINLRNKRFELASTIRKLDGETSAYKKKQLDSLKLIADNTAIQSLQLADTIKEDLQRYFKNNLTTLEARSQFNQDLKAKILAKKCIQAVIE